MQENNYFACPMCGDPEINVHCQTCGDSGEACSRCLLHVDLSDVCDRCGSVVCSSHIVDAKYYVCGGCDDSFVAESGLEFQACPGCNASEIHVYMEKSMCTDCYEVISVSDVDDRGDFTIHVCSSCSCVSTDLKSICEIMDDRSGGYDGIPVNYTVDLSKYSEMPHPSVGRMSKYFNRSVSVNYLMLCDDCYTMRLTQGVILINGTNFR